MIPETNPLQAHFSLDSRPPFRLMSHWTALELDAAFFHLYFPTDRHGSWRTARHSDGCPSHETPEQRIELKRRFPTPRDAVAYIMDTFPIIRRKDENRCNEYRTKRVILEFYDLLQQSIATRQFPLPTDSALSES